MLPEYEHIYGLYTVELECIERSTKDIALNLDQQSLLGEIGKITVLSLM